MQASRAMDFFEITASDSALDFSVLPEIGHLLPLVAGRVFVLCGPPGCGKGTSASIISKMLGIVHLSTGDLFRAEVARGSELGLKISAYMTAGDFVPPEIANKLLAARLSSKDIQEKGVLLDGFPRALDHLFDLDAILPSLALPTLRYVSAAVCIDVPETVTVPRITGRRSCSGCGTLYHVEFKQPLKDKECCDSCGMKLIQRKDDNVEIVQNRMNKYKSCCIGLYDELARRDIFFNIAVGKCSAENLAHKIIEAICFPDRFYSVKRNSSYAKLAFLLDCPLYQYHLMQDIHIATDLARDFRDAALAENLNKRTGVTRRFVYLCTSNDLKYAEFVRIFDRYGIEVLRTPPQLLNDLKLGNKASNDANNLNSCEQSNNEEHPLLVRALLHDRSTKGLVPLAVLRETTTLERRSPPAPTNSLNNSTTPSTGEDISIGSNEKSNYIPQAGCASSIRPGVRVWHRSVLHAWKIGSSISIPTNSSISATKGKDSNISSSNFETPIRCYVYHHVTEGYIRNRTGSHNNDDLSMKSSLNAVGSVNHSQSSFDSSSSPIFGWDDIFVVKATGNTYHEHKLQGLKISSRDMVISAFLHAHVYYKHLKSLNHPSWKDFPVNITRAVDFSVDVAEFVRREYYYNSPWAVKMGLRGMLNKVLNEGIFFKAADTRLEANYWQPGLNAGLPLIGKKDTIHEKTFMFHDYGHFLMKDLIFTGYDSPLHRAVYISARMISEAVTIMLADGIFVDSIRRSALDLQQQQIAQEDKQPIKRSRVGDDDTHNDTQHHHTSKSNTNNMPDSSTISSAHANCTENVKTADESLLLGGSASHAQYDFSARKIYPLFCDCGLDFSSGIHTPPVTASNEGNDANSLIYNSSTVLPEEPESHSATHTDVHNYEHEIFIRNLRLITKSSVDYTLKGDDTSFKKLILSHQAKKDSESKPNKAGEDDKEELLAAFTTKSLEDFKLKYMPFFVSDYQWTVHNYANMCERTQEMSTWWAITTEVRKYAALVLDVHLETIDEFLRELQSSSSSSSTLADNNDPSNNISNDVHIKGSALEGFEVVDAVFDVIFRKCIAPVFISSSNTRNHMEKSPEQGNNSTANKRKLSSFTDNEHSSILKNDPKLNKIPLHPASIRLQRGFVRYMIGQMGLFARFISVQPDNTNYLAKITSLMLEFIGMPQVYTQPMKEGDEMSNEKDDDHSRLIEVLSAIDHIRKVYEEYVSLLLLKNLLSLDDAHNFKEIYPLFEPFYVTYDQGHEHYANLASIAAEELSVRAYRTHQCTTAEKFYCKPLTEADCRFHDSMATMVETGGGQIEEGVFVTRPGVSLLSTDELLFTRHTSSSTKSQEKTPNLAADMLYATFLVSGISVETSLELVAHSEASVARLTSSKTTAMSTPLYRIQRGNALEELLMKQDQSFDHMTSQTISHPNNANATTLSLQPEFIANATQRQQEIIQAATNGSAIFEGQKGRLRAQQHARAAYERREANRVFSNNYNPETSISSNSSTNIQSSTVTSHKKQLNNKETREWTELRNLTQPGSKVTALCYTMAVADYHKLFIGRMGEAGNEAEVRHVVRLMAETLHKLYPQYILPPHGYLSLSNGAKYSFLKQNTSGTGNELIEENSLAKQIEAAFLRNPMKKAILSIANQHASNHLNSNDNFSAADKLDVQVVLLSVTRLSHAAKQLFASLRISNPSNPSTKCDSTAISPPALLSSTSNDGAVVKDADSDCQQLSEFRSRITYLAFPPRDIQISNDTGMSRISNSSDNREACSKDTMMKSSSSHTSKGIPQASGGQYLHKMLREFQHLSVVGACRLTLAIRVAPGLLLSNEFEVDSATVVDEEKSVNDSFMRRKIAVEELKKLMQPSLSASGVKLAEVKSCNAAATDDTNDAKNTDFIQVLLSMSFKEAHKILKFIAQDTLIGIKSNTPNTSVLLLNRIGREVAEMLHDSFPFMFDALDTYQL